MNTEKDEVIVSVAVTKDEAELLKAIAKKNRRSLRQQAALLILAGAKAEAAQE